MLLCQIEETALEGGGGEGGWRKTGTRETGAKQVVEVGSGSGINDVIVE